MDIYSKLKNGATAEDCIKEFNEEMREARTRIEKEKAERARKTKAINEEIRKARARIEKERVERVKKTKARNDCANALIAYIQTLHPEYDIINTCQPKVISAYLEQLENEMFIPHFFCTIEEEKDEDTKFLDKWISSLK